MDVPMSNKGSEVNKQAAKRRADSYYLVYASLGSDRSLAKLQQTLADLGLDVSLNTLKTYSATYKWQENAGYLDTRNAQVELWNLPTELNDRQARLGVAMQTLAQQGLESLDPSLLSASDAVRLLKVGVDIERLAMGAVTERWEILTNIVNPMMYDLVSIFAQVNAIEDEHERAGEWARRCDPILLTYVPEAGKQN
jgi:hypothetical protein